MSATPDHERGVIAWFTRNTVAANLLMWLIVVSGLIVIPGLKKEVFPEISPRLITVTVAYPGAAPDEVEESICRKVEEAVQGLAGVKKVTSIAAENGGAINVEVMAGIDKDGVLADVKNRVDAIDTFPQEAEKPIVQDQVIRRQGISVAVHGDIGERSLKAIGQRVRDDLAALPEITQVDLVSVREYQVSIEVAEESLRRWGLTFDDVVRAVRRSSLDLPGGSLKTGGGEILLRSLGQAYRGHEFEDLVVVTRPDGSRVRLGEVARVVDGFAETEQASRFDGEPAVLVQAYRVGDQSALDVSAAVHRYVEQSRNRMPEGVSLTTWGDEAELLESRIDLLARNAMVGLVLVFCVLALFLRFQLAFWVALGIPISFLGAIALMPTFDVSINMVSLFAFIVVLGIVVDDAIVVGESVYSELRDGKDGVVAALRGSKRVALPVVFGVMTTIAAFSPMLDVEGNARDMWRQVPLIVIPCLLFSLVESKLILPAHLSHQRPFGSPAPARRGLARLWQPVGRGWQRVQQPFARGLEWGIDRLYRPSLRWCLEWRYLTVATATTVLAVTLALTASGWIRFNFFPEVEGDNVVATLEMPQGTPVEITQRALRRMETAAMAVEAELEASGEGGAFRHVLTSIGEQPFKILMARNRGKMGADSSGSHLGEVNVQLLPAEERALTAADVLRRWRDRVGPIPDALEVSFSSSIVSTGEDINMLLSHRDTGVLRAAAERLRRRLATYAGVEDITDTLRPGKREVQLEIEPRAEPLGLTLADLARQVRQGFYGEEAQRIQRGRDDVKVMVRYPRDRRASLGDLESMRVRTARGDEVPFGAVAQVRYGRGYAAINRSDLARSTNVTATVDPVDGNTRAVIADLEADFVPALRAEFPGLTVSFEGDSKEQETTLRSLARGFLIALFLIYALMAVPFRSYLQPLIVMSVIPFGLVGAIWGHVFMGMDLSIVSMLGLVALTGVVVNDSLVLVDFVNRRRDSGLSVIDAVHQAGVMRFRPILLTSMTTFASLTPMLLEKSVQARFLMPMAVSLAFGVLFATVITMVLVPAGYLILEDLRRCTRWLLGRR